MQEIKKEAVKKVTFILVSSLPREHPFHCFIGKLGFQFYQERELEWGKPLLILNPLISTTVLFHGTSMVLGSIMNKGFPDFLNRVNADIVALQEIKMFSTQANFSFLVITHIGIVPVNRAIRELWSLRKQNHKA